MDMTLVKKLVDSELLVGPQLQALSPITGLAKEQVVHPDIGNFMIKSGNSQAQNSHRPAAV